MRPETLLPDTPELVLVVVASIVIYATLIAWSRLVGPRSFSQMTAFDFGVTVALGAIVGGTATGATPLVGGILGLSMLFILRAVVGHFRRLGLDRLVDNRPIMVMAGGQMSDRYLRLAQITRADVLEALRIAGITSFDQVLAVIVERNGQLSVLRNDGPFDAALFEPVIGREALHGPPR